jgi:hypothetical protein
MRSTLGAGGNRPGGYAARAGVTRRLGACGLSIVGVGAGVLAF